MSAVYAWMCVTVFLLPYTHSHFSSRGSTCCPVWACGASTPLPWTACAEVGLSPCSVSSSFTSTASSNTLTSTPSPSGSASVSVWKPPPRLIVTFFYISSSSLYLRFTNLFFLNLLFLSCFSLFIVFILSSSHHLSLPYLVLYVHQVFSLSFSFLTLSLFLPPSSPYSSFFVLLSFFRGSSSVWGFAFILCLAFRCFVCRVR